MATIFMKIATIKGSSTVKGYQDWIELESLQFAASRRVQTVIGNASNRSVSAPSFSEITVSKPLDKASNPLYLAAAAGKALPEIEIHICHAGETHQPVQKHRLKNVVISEHRQVAHSGGLPHEMLSLNYVRSEVTYIGCDAAGNIQSPHTIACDLETGIMG